jgi:hypothetical protein
MKDVNHLDPGSLLRRALRIVSAFVMLLPAALLAQQYQQANLVSEYGAYYPDLFVGGRLCLRLATIAAY